MIHRKEIISNGQELFNALVAYAKSHGTTAIYPRCVLDLADPVINNLVENGNLERLASGNLTPLRQLVTAASRDIAEGAEARPYSTALVDLATGILDNEVGFPIPELARLLGFDEDGLAYQQISGRWFIVSMPRFERETGVAVRSPIDTYDFDLPVLPKIEGPGLSERRRE